MSHFLVISMLNVIMLRVIIQSAIKVSVIMLSVIILGVIKVSAIHKDVIKDVMKCFILVPGSVANRLEGLSLLCFLARLTCKY